MQISVPNPDITYASHIPQTLTAKLNNCSPSFTSMKFFCKHSVDPAGQTKFGHILIFDTDENQSSVLALSAGGKRLQGEAARVSPRKQVFCMPLQKVCFPNITYCKAPCLSTQALLWKKIAQQASGLLWVLACSLGWVLTQQQKAASSCRPQCPIWVMAQFQL